MIKNIIKLSSLTAEERQFMTLLLQGMSDEVISIIMRIHEDEIGYIHSSAVKEITKLLKQRYNINKKHN